MPQPSKRWPNAPSVPAELKTQPNTADADRRVHRFRIASKSLRTAAVSGTQVRCCHQAAAACHDIDHQFKERNRGCRWRSPQGSDQKPCAAVPRNPGGLPVPPPPPRSKPSPNDSLLITPQSEVATGVGTAKGVRRKSLIVGKPTGSKKPQPLPVALKVDIPEGDSEDPTARDQVTRGTPSGVTRFT